ncbi:MAG: hypothetical protein R2883_05445 [Caldisericia bacterium]
MSGGIRPQIEHQVFEFKPFIEPDELIKFCCVFSLIQKSKNWITRFSERTTIDIITESNDGTRTGE